MAKLRVMGKGGIYLLVKKGRLAAGAESASTIRELLQYIGTSDTVEFDSPAVTLLKQHINTGVN